LLATEPPVHVRSALTDPPLGTRDAPPGAPPAYVDSAVVDDAVVVDGLTLLFVTAVVLTGGEQGWTAATLERVGLVLRRTRVGAQILGGPFPAPPVHVEMVALPFTAEADTTLATAVSAALGSAGWSDVSDLAVARVSTGLLRARMQAAAPGDLERRAHEVWLVDPTAPPDARPPLPAAVPAEGGRP
jgi:hypothetical protein